MATDNEYGRVILSKMFQIDVPSVKITLIAGIGDKRFPIHRLLLMANSTYFTAMLGPNFKEANENEFILDKTDASTLKAIVDFCYTGVIELTGENVPNLLAISSRVALELVEQKCWTFLNSRLTIRNAIDTLVIADRYSGHELRQKAITLIRNAFNDVPLWHIEQLDHRYMEEILRSESLHAAEDFLFERLWSWFRKDAVARGQHMPAFLKLIRLGLVSPQFLRDEKFETIHKKFGCFESTLFTERNRRDSRPDTGFRRRISILCLTKQFRSDDGAECSAVKIERYNCALNEFEEVREIALGDRVGFGATLHENKVYIMGGRIDGVYQKSVAMFDLTTGRKIVLPEMNDARGEFASIVDEKHIYVFGGYNGSSVMNSCERFDLNSKTWKILQPMKVSRSNASLAVLNGRIFVAGGIINKNIITKVVESYNPFSDTWLQLASMNRVRSTFALSKSNSDLYVIGDHHVAERYNMWKMNGWAMVVVTSHGVKSVPTESCFQVDLSSIYGDLASCVETHDGNFYVQSNGEFGQIHLNPMSVTLHPLAKSKYKLNHSRRRCLFQN